MIVEVVVVVGDFFWMPPQLFGSIFGVAGYCFSLGLLRGFRVL